MENFQECKRRCGTGACPADPGNAGAVCPTCSPSGAGPGSVARNGDDQNNPQNEIKHPERTVLRLKQSSARPTPYCRHSSKRSQTPEPFFRCPQTSEAPEQVPAATASLGTETKVERTEADDAPLDLPLAADTPTPEAQRVMLRQASAAGDTAVRPHREGNSS